MILLIQLYTHTHTHTYIYIYIKSSTDRSVSFYQNSSVWLDLLAFRSWDRNPVDSNANPILYNIKNSKTLSQPPSGRRLDESVPILSTLFDL